MAYPFNIPPYLGNEIIYIKDAIDRKKICGDGFYTKQCNEFLADITSSAEVLLTTSCTHALEMAAILLNIKEGDEVIMPSFTFVSTANAFAIRGAKCVFIDVRPDTMNMDENLIEQAITPATKAIVPVHYAGQACEMDTICAIAKKYNLAVVEDAAQAVTSTYKGKQMGAIGDIGCFSFHETKNFSMGEGGAILLKTPELAERAEIIREKGTNRSRFFRGFVDKYTWVDIGSSYLPSELNAAYLWGQLENHKTITAGRVKAWQSYYKLLKPLEEKGLIEFQAQIEHCTHNAHMFYIKLKDLDERTELINHLKSKDIQAVFHYIPLHSAEAGKKFGAFIGEDKYTTSNSERLLRLPLYYGLMPEDCEIIADEIYNFFKIKP